jgi:hypothetical protein
MLLQPLLRFHQFQRVRAGGQRLAEERVRIESERGNESIQPFWRQELVLRLLPYHILLRLQ